LLEPTERMIDSGAIEIRDRLGLISGGRILDVGTYEGGFISTLMKCLKDYQSFIGIDIEEEYLEKAREEFKNDPAEFQVMDAENLSFSDNSFDTVSISHSFHHLKNIDSVLSEIKRVLKPGGHLIIQEMFCDGKQSESQKTDIMIHHWDAEVDSLRDIPHYKTFTRQKLNDTVAEIGMNNVETFESNRYVKCLFCSDILECEDPKNEDLIKVSLREIDKILENSKDTPVFDRMNETAVTLRARLNQTGSSSASLLFFICN